jgi:hypothetical protein
MSQQPNSETNAPAAPALSQQWPGAVVTEMPAGLFGPDEAAAIIFPSPTSRPCTRTWRHWQKLKIIPTVKVGRRTFFNARECAAALAKQFTIKARV